MFENPRRGRQARNFTKNVPKILDLKSSSEQIFSENWRWVPLILAMKCLFTWTKRRLLRLFRKLSTRQNLHLKAEMFSFHSKYFVYGQLKRAPQTGWVFVLSVRILVIVFKFSFISNWPPNCDRFSGSCLMIASADHSNQWVLFSKHLFWNRRRSLVSWLH